MTCIKMTTLLSEKLGPDEVKAFIQQIEIAEGKKFVRERIDGKDCLRMDISRHGVGNIRSFLFEIPGAALKNLDH